MNSSRDPLIAIFERHINNSQCLEESQSEFIKKVVDEFVLHLRTLGTVSQAHEEEIKEDVEQEVLQLLKIKTYGHFSLFRFRLSLSKQKSKVEV